MPYIDWEYYHSLFDNITDEKAFNRTYAKAEVYMDRYTAMRARAFLKAYDEDNATDFQNMTANAVNDHVRDNQQYSSTRSFGNGNRDSFCIQ